MIPPAAPVHAWNHASLDEASGDWLTALTGGVAVREAAQSRLHALLLRIARAEAQRRSGRDG